MESRYNPRISVVDNIKLPPTLLSKFDLMYLILNAPNVEKDRRITQYLVGLYYDNPNVVQPIKKGKTDFLDKDFTTISSLYVYNK